MQKIVINNTYGGFSMSDEAIAEYCEQRGIEDTANFYYYDLHRDDQTLVGMVENLGSEFVSGGRSELKVVEVPDDVEWVICDYDGMEWVAEKHRTWY
jgi:hypothetical protein